MKSLSSIASCALLLAAAGTIASAADRRPQTSTKLTKAPAKIHSPKAILYDQTDFSSGVGLVSQDFEAAFDGFDSQGADDFVIPAATTWSIDGATFPAVYFNGAGPMAALNLTFFNDAAGLPGSIACNYPGTVPTSDVAGTVTVAFAPCILGAGHYWVSAQARMDFAVGGEWGWNGRSVQSNLAAKWQNPLGGFGVGCTTWGDMNVCLGQPGSLDFQFQLTGTIVTPLLTCQVGSNYATGTSAGTIIPGVVDTGNHCDDCTTNIALPFPVASYDQVFNTANVASNGSLQFVSSNTGFTNPCPMPVATIDSAILMWDDMRTDAQAGCVAYPGGVCGIFTDTTGSAPNRVFHVEWRAVYFDFPQNTNNFEVRLHEDNANFEIVTGTQFLGGSSTTAGVQRDTGSLFTEFACNTAVPDNTQISFTCTLVPVELMGFSVE